MSPLQRGTAAQRQGVAHTDFMCKANGQSIIPGMFSPEIDVMFRPKRAFAEMTVPVEDNRRLYWRRPLFVVLIMCCAISLMTAARLSLHLVASTAIYWSFLPLVEIAGLAAVERGHLKAGTVDRFFMGHGPWLLFMTIFAAYVSSPEGLVLSSSVFNLWVGVAAAVLVWSCWIDYRFFNSLRKLVVQRAVSWTLFASIFMGSWLWNEIAWRLGL
jgi:hypothetical protein